MTTARQSQIIYDLKANEEKTFYLHDTDVYSSTKLGCPKVKYQMLSHTREKIKQYDVIMKNH